MMTRLVCCVLFQSKYPLKKQQPVFKLLRLWIFKLSQPKTGVKMLFSFFIFSHKCLLVCLRLHSVWVSVDSERLPSSQQCWYTLWDRSSEVTDAETKKHFSIYSYCGHLKKKKQQPSSSFTITPSGCYTVYSLFGWIMRSGWRALITLVDFVKLAQRTMQLCFGPYWHLQCCGVVLQTAPFFQA